MTDRREDIEAVLGEYARACKSRFNAEVLATFTCAYPQHRRALLRFAVVQLTSVPAYQPDPAASASPGSRP